MDLEHLRNRVKSLAGNLSADQLKTLLYKTKDQQVLRFHELTNPDDIIDCWWFVERPDDVEVPDKYGHLIFGIDQKGHHEKQTDDPVTNEGPSESGSDESDNAGKEQRSDVERW